MPAQTLFQSPGTNSELTKKKTHKKTLFSWGDSKFKNRYKIYNVLEDDTSYREKAEKAGEEFGNVEP